MFRTLAITLLGSIAVGSLALAQTFAPDMPILGGPSYCVTTVNNVCQQTIPAGPGITGNETVPADTNAPGGQVPQSGKIPVAVLYNHYNGLIGGDFAQNLWQRSTTPINALNTGSAAMAADAWYVYSPSTQTTVTKQTGAADQPPGSTASMRIARPNAQTGIALVCTGQLLPNDSSEVFINTANSVTSPTPIGVRTTIFSVDMLAGANFSGTGVNMVIAYHSAADATAAANGQGTNTATFASSLTGTQNITNYTEGVNTLTPITTTWTRYSVAVSIPYYITGTTQTLGVGVKLCFTPVGTAGANDWFEIGDAQLEYRGGTSTAPSPFYRRLLADEWNLQYARYFQLNEGGTATPVFANGMIAGTQNFIFQILYPITMRITPVISPITVGGFKAMVSSTQTTIAGLNSQFVTQNAATMGASTTATGTAGQAAQLIGTGQSTGKIGFSAEP